MKLWLFWTLWSLSVLLAAVLVFFFFAGIVDGTVSSFNLGLWFVLLAVTGGVIGGSFWLQRIRRPLLGLIPLLVLLLPGGFFALYSLLFIFGHGRMN